MVRLIHLKLENIRSYRAADIQFREGVNTIVGRNGAGKSTILQAIGYALFDSLEGRKPDFVREGSSSGSIAVGLAEDGEGSSYEVVRELRKSGSADWFVFDLAREVEVCRGSQDVRFFVQDLCHTRIDLELLYTGIIGIQQGEFARPFRLTPAPRQAHFSPLLEVEKYKEAFTRLGQANGPKGVIRDRINELATEIARWEVRLENREALELEQQALSRTLANLAEEAETIRHRLQTLAKLSKEFEQAKRELEAAKDRHGRAQHELTAIRQQLETAGEELRHSTDALQIVEANQGGHDRYLETQGQLDRLTHDLRTMRDLSRRKDLLDERRGACRDQLAQKCSQLRHLDELPNRQSLLADTTRQYETLDRERIALEHRGGSTADLQQAIALAQDEVGHRQFHVKELTSGLDARRQALAEVQTLEETRDGLTEQTRRLQQQSALANHRLAQIHQQLSMLKGPDDQAVEPVHLCPVCNQPIEEALWLDLVAKGEAEEQDLQDQVSRLARELADNRQDARRVETELDRLQSTVAGMPDETALLQAQSDLKMARRELHRVEAQLTEREEQEQQLQAIKAELANLRDDWAAYRDNQRQIDARSEIEAETTRLETNIASLDAELQSLETELAPLSDLEEREASLTATLDTTRQAYEDVLKNERAAAQKPERETRHRELKAQTEAQEASLAAAADELASCTVAYDECAHVAHQAEVRQQELDARDRRTRLEETHQRLGALDAHLEELKALDDRLIAKRVEHAAWEQRESDLEAMRHALRDMQPLMTRILNRRISQGANAIHQELTNSTTAELTWGETFDITLKVLGRERAFSQLSGGEQMTAALAVNLAMLQELSTVGFAFFDEPTTNLDEDRRTELATRLNTTRQVPQLIVISHDDTFEARVDHVIRVAKTGNESEIQTQDA
ncbi:MAG: SMC family ATPase [Caldilineaceae bacterium SB0666_bin_21]|nr:SMC family ATPase [Caldilineaceae bacterium SB0666_bin_21]